MRSPDITVETRLCVPEKWEETDGENQQGRRKDLVLLTSTSLQAIL
jgi:hypothetical protein